MSARATQERERTARALAALNPASTATLLLCRHGETSWNAEGRLQGQLFPGPSLSGQGHAQARALAAGFALAQSRPLSAIYASDLARAVETARAVAAALPPPSPPAVRLLPALRERNVGRLLEGVRRAEAPSVALEAFEALRRSPRDPSCPLPGGGESLDAVARRVGRALRAIARAHAGERALVVSHGGAIHAARRYAEGFGGGGGGGSGSGSGGGPLPNGAICEFRIDVGLDDEGDEEEDEEEEEGGASAAAAEAEAAGATRAVARGPGGQWRRGWAIARWGDCGLLGAGAAQARTEGGGADAG